MKTKKDLEKMGEHEVRNSLARGDYIDPSEISFIESWLQGKDDARTFEEACERAHKTAAFDAKEAASRAEDRANRADERAERAEKKATIAATAAVIAAIGAIISAIWPILSTFIKSPCGK